MEPLSIGLLAGSIFAGLTGSELGSAQGLAGLARAQAVRADPLAPATARLPPAGGRIEIADLRERVRKLEAIAAGSTSKLTPAARSPQQAARRSGHP